MLHHVLHSIKLKLSKTYREKYIKQRKWAELMYQNRAIMLGVEKHAKGK